MATALAETWLILPTYNEAANIEAFVEAVRSELPPSRRILIVDDSSPDGTGRIADGLAAANSDVEVLHRPRKEGLGPAYIAGFETALAAGASLVLEMDSDFSHDPADLGRLIEGARDADVVLGSRYVEGGGIEEWSAGRRVISRLGCAYARFILGVPVRDLTGGFKCIRAEVLRSIDIESIPTHGYAFQIETTYRALRAGYRVLEVPITFHERRAGESKMSPSIAAEAVLRVPLMRRRASHTPSS